MSIIEMVKFIREEERKQPELRTLESKNRVQEYKNFLYEHYTNTFVNYKEINKDIKNIEQLYTSTIKTLCDNYLSKRYTTSFYTYIKNSLIRMTEKKKFEIQFRHNREFQVFELIQQAKEGNEESKKLLIQHYVDFYDYFIEENNHVKNIEVLYPKLVKTIIDHYIDNGQTHSLSESIKPKLEGVAKSGNWDINNIEEILSPVTDLIKKAKEGSLEAKQKLIERYMYVVDKNIEKYNIDIDYEEARQIGYLYLTEKVNAYLNNGCDTIFSTYLLSAFNSCFYDLLMEEKIRNDQNYELKNIKCDLTAMDFEEANLYFEIYDFLDRKNLKPKDRYVIEQLLNGKIQAEITPELGVSRTLISSIVKKDRKVLTKFLNIK